MSLGPPFDDSGERLQIGVGAGAFVVLLFGVSFAILAAERSLGDSLTVHVQVARPGALHTGAPLRVAGEPIGEVVAIRGRPTETAQAQAPSGATAVDIEVRLLKSYRERLRKNSTVVTVNPTLLTEAVLEVGPPARGEPPREPVDEGDSLRGVDPADIDQFLFRVYVGIESILRETRDLSPDWSEFQESAALASAQLGAALPTTDLLRLGIHTAQARINAKALGDKLEAAGADRAPAELRALYQNTQPLISEFGRLAQQLEMLNNRSSELSTALESRRRDVAHALLLLRTAGDLSARSEADARVLWKGFVAGHGSLGAFNNDIQIFDELKEIHRILKRESWRLLIKRPDKGQRNIR